MGFKLHMAVDIASGVPLTFMVAPANVNEKKLATDLLEKTVSITGNEIWHLTAGSQYSSNKLRRTAESLGIKTAIPYPRNQGIGEHNVLRVASDFKAHGPESLRRMYRKRSIIELVFAWLKEHLSLNNHKVRGLKNIIIHTSYCILCFLYIIEASRNTKQATKSKSITYWAN